MKITGAKIWNSKNASLCRVFANRVTFMTRNQGSAEEVSDYVEELKKLFMEAYPKEASTSAILLQRFITGLRTSISCQLLLHGKP